MKKALAKIDALSLRERVILLVAGLLLIYLIWFSFLYEPVVKEKQLIQSDMETIRQQIETQKLQLQTLAAKKVPDPNVKNRERQERLSSELQQVEQQIVTSTDHLIEPEVMPAILRSMLESTKGLTLISMNGLGRQPLIKPDEGDAEAGEEEAADDTAADNGRIDTAYRHGMRIVFEGSYLQTVEYIKKLEQLQWKFIWDQIVFDVAEYPDSRSTLTLYTLSLDENWIDI